MLNIVAIMGRLVADPELKKTQSGQSVCSFTVACDRSFCKPGEKRQTDFIDCTAWRGTGEFVDKYFTKGQLIAVDGRLETGIYTDKDGNKRKTCKLVAQNVNFAGSKAGNTERKAEPDATPKPEDFSVVEESEDLPF